jgi:hypothetical protein
VPFILGGAGAYLGSYLKRKGENLATHEDIDKLVDQVAAVTTTTKEIEAKISRDLWDRQKHWEAKRDILFDAAKRLHDVENKLSSLYTFWRMEINGEIQAKGSELERKSLAEWEKSCSAFDEIVNSVLKA